MIKSVFFLRFLFLHLLACCLLPTNAQDGVFKNISQSFDTFNQLYLKEKIYLHSDKNLYLAGEIAWFKIYCVDGSNHRPINISKVAYVEILDRNSKPVLQAKILLTDNGGNGSFYLPLTLNSGNYTLRAYTNWMKNAGQQVFFEKKISIINTIRTSTGISPVVSLGADIAFFPEGGYMVEGIETKVAFRITNKSGRGISGGGVVTDNTGDTMLSFSSFRFGIGHFMFKPLADKKYKAIVVVTDGQKIIQELPEVKSSGYVMNVTDNKDGRWKVSVRAKASQVNETGEDIFLLAHCRGSIQFSAQQFISYDKEAVFFVDKGKLGEGVNEVTLFNKNRQPVCERLLFSRPATLVTPQLATDKQVYSFRQPVDLSVLLTSAGIADANCSVSVYQADPERDSDNITIRNYLILLADLRGNVESPGYYFSDEEGVAEATDNLMMTHGWRRFNWRNILNNDLTKAAFKFDPEYHGHIISGRVVNISNGNAVAGAECYLTLPAEPFGLYINESDSTGVVRFDTKDYYGPGELFAQVMEQNTGRYRVDILSPFADNPSFSALPDFILPSKEESDYLLQRSIAMQAQNIYRADSIRHFIIPQLVDTIPFYGKPELSYLLDDYKRFTTMEEVLREYVVQVNVILKNGKLHISIYDDAIGEVYRDNTLLLLDGVPLPDYNRIFSYDPLKVKRIDIVPKRYLYGNRLFSGVVSFETYKGKFDAFELDPSLIAVDYEGLQLQREFYSPLYDAGNENSRIPDLRTTLYWNPDLQISGPGNASSHFYTSDHPGKFIVALEGITKDGKPVCGSSTFTVK